MFGYRGPSVGIPAPVEREDTKPITRGPDPELARRQALETDDALRTRLHYVAGGKNEPHTGARIERAHGDELDAIADEYGLKRRGRP